MHLRSDYTTPEQLPLLELEKYTLNTEASFVRKQNSWINQYNQVHI